MVIADGYNEARAREIRHQLFQEAKDRLHDGPSVRIMEAISSAIPSVTFVLRDTIDTLENPNDPPMAILNGPFQTRPVGILIRDDGKSFRAHEVTYARLSVNTPVAQDGAIYVNCEEVVTSQARDDRNQVVGENSLARLKWTDTLREPGSLQAFSAQMLLAAIKRAKIISEEFTQQLEDIFAAEEE